MTDAWRISVSTERFSRTPQIGVHQSSKLERAFSDGGELAAGRDRGSGRSATRRDATPPRCRRRARHRNTVRCGSVRRARHAERAPRRRRVSAAAVGALVTASNLVGRVGTSKMTANCPRVVAAIFAVGVAFTTAARVESSIIARSRLHRSHPNRHSLRTMLLSMLSSCRPFELLRRHHRCSNALASALSSLRTDGRTAAAWNRYASLM